MLRVSLQQLNFLSQRRLFGYRKSLSAAPATATCGASGVGSGHSTACSYATGFIPGHVSIMQGARDDRH